MSDEQQTTNEVLATIDAALAILNRFPDLDQGELELSTNSSISPLSFLVELFKRTAGYNHLINILARFIAYELPAIEAAIKAMLISQLKDILSCSVNPFITEEILKKGVTFNLSEIDISDILKYSPLDTKIGKCFYFGTDDMNSTDDLVRCSDMDAFIWYIVNKANRRHTWNNSKGRPVVTLEYNERSSNLTDAEGNTYSTQTPYNNVLHVFIGDTTEKDSDKLEELKNYEDDIRSTERNIQKLDSEINRDNYRKNSLEEDKIDLDSKLSNNEIDGNTYKEKYGSLIKQLETINSNISHKESNRLKKYKEKKGLQYKIGSYTFGPGEYDTVEGNHYKGRTLIEFNTDYLMSVRLFEQKALATKLIEAITGILTIDLSFSYKQQLIKNEVKKMVQMIVETDDVVVSDCFFSFSNDDYDAMSRQAELRKAGLLSINGNETSAVKINAEDILSSLNELNDKSSKETVMSVIEGSLTTLSKELSDVNYEEKTNVNFGVQMNIIENILNQLAYVMVMAVLSPKIYLLLLINLKILGRETNFNLEQFINSYKQMLAALIRAIRDYLVEYMVNELMKMIGDIVKDVAMKLTIEQSAYYTRLIKRLINCFKNNRDGLDFEVADVDYADIISTDEEPPNTNC